MLSKLEEKALSEGYNSIFLDAVKGYLLGTVSIDGKLKSCYQHINTKNQLRTGICNSTPQILSDGRIRLIVILICI